MQRSLRGNEFLFLVSDHHKNFLLEKEDSLDVFVAGGELQPHDAHQVLRGHQLRQGQHQQGADEGDLPCLAADTLSRVPLTRTCHVPAGVTCHVAAAGSVWLGSRGTQSRTLAVALQPGCCSSRVFHGPTHRACRYGCGNI